MASSKCSIIRRDIPGRIWRTFCFKRFHGKVLNNKRFGVFCFPTSKCPLSPGYLFYPPWTGISDKHTWWISIHFRSFFFVQTINLDCSKDHAEAIMAISSHLRGVSPTQQVVKMLLARDEEEFVVATFYHWAKEEKTRSAFVECMVPILHRVSDKEDQKLEWRLSVVLFRLRVKRLVSLRARQIVAQTLPSVQLFLKSWRSWTVFGSMESQDRLDSTNAPRVSLA